MALRFFTIPVAQPEPTASELNSFLANHRVLVVERHLIDQGGGSFWAVCVDYLEGSPVSTGRPGPSRGKVDYKEILSAEEFTLFAKLRDLRKEIAQAEAVPVYTIFTNEQLAGMVQAKATTKSDLESIAGVGDARIEKYGDRFLTCLNEKSANNGEKGRPTI